MAPADDLAPVIVKFPGSASSGGSDLDPKASRKPAKRRAARRPLDDARRELAEDYIPLARTIAEPFGKAFRGHANDIFGSAYLGLAEAASSFDFDGPIAFGSFARTRIRGEILNYLATIARGGVDDAAAGRDRGFACHPSPDAIEPRHARAAIAAADEVDWPDFFDGATRALSPKHRKVMRARYFEGKTQVETAQTLRISQTEVCRVERVSMDHLRQALSA